MRRLNATLATYKPRSAGGDVPKGTARKSKKPTKKGNSEAAVSAEIEHRRMFKARMDLTSKEFYPNVGISCFTH